MKKSKKFVMVGFVLLVAITMVLLPLSGCKTEVDTSAPQQEQTGDSDSTCSHTAVIERGYCTACNELLDSVDLGLSVKWATMNVGATKPEEYGDYFSWGETEPKDNYLPSKYKYTHNGKPVLEPIDDAATANWGEAWRMPTEEEMTMLIEKGDWTWTTLNGVSGYEVKGSNNNSIFLPTAGYYSGSSLLSKGSAGSYWTSSLNTAVAAAAYSLRVSESKYEHQGSQSRVSGFSVRPVCE